MLPNPTSLVSRSIPSPHVFWPFPLVPCFDPTTSFTLSVWPNLSIPLSRHRVAGSSRQPLPYHLPTIGRVCQYPSVGFHQNPPDSPLGESNKPTSHQGTVCCPRGGGYLLSQPNIPATSAFSYSEAHQHLRNQLFISIASAPIASSTLKSFNNTHVTMSSKKLRCTISGNSAYLSKAENLGSPTWGIRILECFPWKTSANGRPVLVQTFPKRMQLPPLWEINHRAT